MLKLLIFGYSSGVTSSRAWERRCLHDVAFMFLTAKAAPDFVAISRFRKRHLKAFTALFTQALGCVRRPSWCRWAMSRWTAARSEPQPAGIGR